MSHYQFTNTKGEKILVEKDKIEFRPSAYGIILHNDKILLTVMRSTGKWALPGGALEKGESLIDTLKREVQEECGIEVVVRQLLFTEETNFYYEPSDKAWQVFAFCYLAEAQSLDLRDTTDTTDEAEHAVWVPVSELKLENFQVFGKQILEAIGNLKKTTI